MAYSLMHALLVACLLERVPLDIFKCEVTDTEVIANVNATIVAGR